MSEGGCRVRGSREPKVVCGLGSSMSDLPSRETLDGAICTVMAGSNLSELSSKTVRKSLESMLEIDLKPHKEYIDELLMGQVDAAHASAAASAATRPSRACGTRPRERCCRYGVHILHATATATARRGGGPALGPVTGGLELQPGGCCLTGDG